MVPTSPILLDFFLKGGIATPLAVSSQVYPGCSRCPYLPLSPYRPSLIIYPLIAHPLSSIPLLPSTRPLRPSYPLVPLVPCNFPCCLRLSLVHLVSLTVPSSGSGLSSQRHLDPPFRVPCVRFDPWLLDPRCFLTPLNPSPSFSSNPPFPTHSIISGVVRLIEPSFRFLTTLSPVWISRPVSSMNDRSQRTSF